MSVIKINPDLNQWEIKKAVLFILKFGLIFMLWHGNFFYKLFFRRLTLFCLLFLAEVAAYKTYRMYTDCFPGRSYSDRFTRLVRLLIPVFSTVQHLLWWPQLRWRRMSKIRLKLDLKKFVKLTDHTYVCNSLTNFEYKTHPPETEKIYVNLLKSV